jgi:hypothetical protein
VLAQALQIARFKPDAFCDADPIARQEQLAIGKDVGLIKCSLAPEIPTNSSPKNHVIVIGALDAIRDRGKEVLHRAQRNTRRGRIEHLAIQVRSL